MLRLVSLLVSLATFAAAQQTNFEPGTGVRSLWVCQTLYQMKLRASQTQENMLTRKQIPFKTVDGVPLASISARVSGEST